MNWNEVEQEANEEISCKMLRKKQMVSRKNETLTSNVDGSKEPLSSSALVPSPLVLEDLQVVVIQASLEHHGS